MSAVVSALAWLVRRAPALTVAAAIVATVAFGVLTTRVEVAVGNEGFAPDNVHLRASETLSKEFGASGEEVLQILVRRDGELLSTDGLQAVAAVTEALTSSDAAAHLARREGRPPIVHPFGPTREALAAQGRSLDEVDDATVRATFAETLADLPEAEAEQLGRLLPADADLRAPSTDAALLFVFVSAEELPASGSERFDALIEIQSELLAAAEGAAVGPDVTVSGFSFPLLFADTDAFDSELARLFTAAFLIIVVILGIVYWLRPQAALRPLRAGRRTLADVLLTMATIVAAIVWMNGLAALLGPGVLGLIGPLTEVTQIIPILLIGLGVDYAIHLTARYREEVGEGAAVAEGMSRAVRTVGVALALATVTTAVGFLTNIVNPVPTLRDFGVIAAGGILAAFVLMLTFVPALRVLLDRRAERAGRLPGAALAGTSQRLLPAAMARTALLPERAPVITLVVTVVLGGALGVWGLSQLETRFSSTDFVPEGSEVLAALETIEARFGGGFGETTEVLLTGDLAEPAAHDALAEAMDEVGALPWVVTAGGEPVGESPIDLFERLAVGGPGGEPAAPAVAEVAAAEGFEPGQGFPADADVGAVYAAMAQAAPQQTARVLDFADAATGTPPEAVSHARIALRTTAGEDAARELREALEVVFAPLAATGVGVVVTSNEIINDTIITALQQAQVSSLVITLLAVLVLLVASFWVRDRRPVLGVLTTAPVLLAVLWTFAMMAATGIPFGPVTATIAALAIGIGIPYAIHITNRFEEDRRRLPPLEAVRSTVRHTGGALAGSALTTCAGFGVLVTSSLLPFRQFGLVTVYAIGFALLAAILVLPSALTLADRWQRRRSGAGTKSPADAVAESSV